jgi:pyruvate dehydrogenase E1 component beta subunit
VQEGNDVTIVTFGKMMRVVELAVKELEAKNISVEVIDLRTVRPIDYNTLLNSIKKTNRMVVVEEAWPLASISSEIAYWVQNEAFDYMDAPVKRVTSRDTPLPYAPTLVEIYLPTVARVVAAVDSVLYR